MNARSTLKLRAAVLFVSALLARDAGAAAAAPPAVPGERTLRTPEYRTLQKRLASGWSTWNTNSVMSHVHLPDGFALTLGLKNSGTGLHYQREVFQANDTLKRPEKIRLGPHADDGSYTELEMRWDRNHYLVQSATEGDDVVVVVTLNERHPLRPSHLCNATTGAGNDVTSSDAYDHWGALLGVITLLGEGR